MRSDLELPNELKCHEQSESFLKSWREETQKPEPSLARALFNTYSREFYEVAHVLACLK